MIRPESGIPALRCCCSRRRIFCLACSIEISSHWRVYGSENESITGGIVGGWGRKGPVNIQLMYWLRYLHKSSSESRLGNSVCGCRISSIRVTVPCRIWVWACGFGFCPIQQRSSNNIINYYWQAEAELGITTILAILTGPNPRIPTDKSTIPSRTGTECGGKWVGLSSRERSRDSEHSQRYGSQSHDQAFSGTAQRSHLRSFPTTAPNISGYFIQHFLLPQVLFFTRKFDRMIIYHNQKNLPSYMWWLSASAVRSQVFTVKSRLTFTSFGLTRDLIIIMNGTY